MKTFSLARGWQIFIVVTCAVLALGALVGLVICTKAAISNPADTGNWTFIACIFLGLFLLVYAIVEALKGKLVVHKDKFEFISAFGTRELLFIHVKGFKTDDKYLRIHPLADKGKNINISTYFGNIAELETWMSTHFQDIDIAEKAEEQERLLVNVDYGQTTAERELALVAAKRTARIINIIGVVLAVSLFIAGDYLHYTWIATAIFTVVSVLVLRYYKGLIRLDENKNSPYPSIFFGFFGSITGLLLKSLLTFHILDHSNVWAPVGLLATALLVLLVLKNKEFEQFNKQTIFMIVFCAVISFAYGYGVVTGFNCVYDSTPPSKYTSDVLEKRISGRKSTAYYLTLSPWGPVKESDEVDVSGDTYAETKIGDHVNIYLFKGKMEIPWYVVENQ
ncbi:hypothetical protein [Pedobacter sp. MC2016-24]|uniref:hypothetical protein n=1 Tax=Pedobacter sp. MC2016-24 TaxID=2780090 RepID=UPI001881AE57|nr:hypothetical protein [Pedobacter sp. MC2016-24]MBE9602358.1 hypothetical protein [Pedobacter sp. MC2016-24]